LRALDGFVWCLEAVAVVAKQLGHGLVAELEAVLDQLSELTGVDIPTTAPTG